MDISLFMSAARPKWWKRMYKSLVGNKCKWEIIAVGPHEPKFELPWNFKYYYCPYKPTQCYQAAASRCQGELIGWTADDAVYDSQSLDLIWDRYRNAYRPRKYIFTQSTIENGKNVTEEHYFFRFCKDTPQMAPMAFIKKSWFDYLGGYDRNFVSGQAENDIVCRAFADCQGVEPHGIIHIPESKVYLNHEEVHGGFINKIKYRMGKNSFRTGYYSDRRYLEECWVKEGFGTYNEKTLKHGTVSPVRLLAHQGFNYDNILTVAQGPQGRWEK